MAKVIKSKQFNEHVYWVLYKYQETVEEPSTDPEIKPTLVTRTDEGWTFITAPALILSQPQLWALQSQIAKEGKFDKCLIKDFKRLISR